MINYILVHAKSKAYTKYKQII